MTWLDSFKETNKPIEYKKVWYDNKVYLLPCDPKLVKIVLRSDTEPEFIYEDDEFSKEYKEFEKYLNESIINKIDTDELVESMSIVKVLYKSGEWSTVATNNSEFKQIREIAYAHSADDRTLSAITKSVRYYIDNNEVDENTFEDTIKRLELMIYSKTKRRCVWKTLNGSDGETIWKIKESVYLENVSSPDNDSYKEYHDDYYGLGKLQTKIRGKRADCCIYDDCMYFRGSTYTQLKEILNSIKKENEEMVDYKKINDDIFKEYCTAVNKRFMVRPQIVNYQYNETTGETTVYWDDKTQTTVKADNISEASQFEGFCAACAKKLFGNKSTYLNQFDKWTVKIPERERLAAEKKAAEDKAHEEAKARKAAKKAERKKQREIEKLAKQIADEYYAQELTEEAEKLAVKKYGVPKSYLDEYDCDCCECKEFDVMDDETITD